MLQPPAFYTVTRTVLLYQFGEEGLRLIFFFKTLIFAEFE